ncbi:DUF397 domain-containing protein [Actinoalloteichus hymeniacidonis]|uniref:DUF397 family protein n=1 Tax=Actinoalloteichus hymeniacidonis TaxID=340345 RepID=A0AAC9HUE0_9PSEU|nr:DUF397 domain-containing protein [Actinoalloteichus hymeniacidonis]AOS65514.1 putative DUF397 family protein [Actinoalloteichus hymeniacidonis]MBB5906399.1 hypothetical protein [Actinoalloteichus hymeniacidonis]
MTRLVEHAGWRKSRRSQNTSNCVEIRHAAEQVGIRDTKNRAGGVLIVDCAAFGFFLNAIKSNSLGDRSSAELAD